MLLSAIAAVPNKIEGQEIFSDGFETGDASRWSIQVPVADPVDGTYHFAAYDSLTFASGGNLVIANGTVEVINGTYRNLDKVDGFGIPRCTLIFRWGVGLIPTNVNNFESGVVFTDTYPDSSMMTWTLTFSIEDNIGFSGTLAAVGASFTGVDSGCNGTFPPLTIRGGKSNPNTQ